MPTSKEEVEWVQVSDKTAVIERGDWINVESGEMPPDVSVVCVGRPSGPMSALVSWLNVGMFVGGFD